MPSNTPNLNLYKKNPATDGDDTFNIETMINENLDKIDEHAGDNTRHISAAERNTWNAKETTAGAQAKADAAEAAAKAASIPIGQKGAAGGVADLDASGKVPRDRSYSSLGGRGGAANLDTAFLAGIWVFVPGATGSPEPSGYGLLEVIVSDGDLYDGSTNWIFQIVRMTGGAVYSRIKVNQGVWSAWNLEGGDRVFKTKSIVDVDYNLLTTTGIYQIYGIIPPNAPPLSAPWGILNVYVGSNGYIVQEATQTTAPYGKWHRTRTETDWGPWLNVAVQGREARFDGVDGRSVQNFKTPADPPSTYPGGQSIFFVNNITGWPGSAYGTVVSTRGHTNPGGNAVLQFFYPYNVAAPIKYRYSIIGGDAWGAWDTLLTGENAKRYAKAGNIVTFGGTGTGITTAEFITMLKNMGAYSPEGGYWVGRGNWSYAVNVHITDSSFGNIHLAGAVVEVIGYLDGDTFTIRITTPTTSGVDQTTANCEFIYVSNGPTYAPGWRKSLNSVNTSGIEGLGKTITDANTLATNGSYITTATWTGSPLAGTDGANQGYLTHTRWNNDNSYAIQTFMPVNTVDVPRMGMWYRRRALGVWGSWARMWTSENDVSLLKSKGQVAGGVDYNTLVEPGSYLMTDAVHPNGPTRAYSILNVTRTGNPPGGFVRQEVAEIFGAWIQYRTRTDGGTWSGWIEVLNSTSGSSFVSRSVPSSGEDLNNKTALGMYTLGASNDYVNGPGLDWCVLNVYRNSGGYMVQEATNVGTANPQKRFRTRTEANVWSRWIDVVTTDSTGKIPGVAANRAVAKEVMLTTTDVTTIAAYTIPAARNMTVKASVLIDAAKLVGISVAFKDTRGNGQEIPILPQTNMTTGRFEFIPATFCAGAGVVYVMAKVGSPNGVYFSTTITEEG